MSFPQLFNLIEGCWWWLCAGVVFWKQRTWTGPNATTARILCVALIAFGISDFWEVNTGAWYHPWQLKTLNTICVVTFVYCGIQFLRERRKVESE